MAATPDQTEQQRRVILTTKNHVNAFLVAYEAMLADNGAYVALGMADVLDDKAFEGTGTNAVDFKAAIVSIGNTKTMMDAGNLTNFSKFSL